MKNDDYIKRSDAISAIHAVPPGLWSRARYMDVVERVPAADVEPVRHGRWIINEINDDIRVLICSCGFHEKRSMDLRIPRYCEQCGVKMDAEPPKGEE